MSSKNTPLTEEMIDSFPAVDPHVHVPGTISPATAWELGLRNKLMHMEQNADGTWKVVDGPNHIGQLKEDGTSTDPVGAYSNLFISEGDHPLTFDDAGKPIRLDYNYHCLPNKPDIFSGFDAIQGTTQGHRNRPGGIQNEDDYRFVMRAYLESCKTQNIKYAETSQNITIAEVLYPNIEPKDARKKFFHLCKEIVGEFEHEGVALRFTHCANKTDASGIKRPLSVRANEWADWLQEAIDEVPGIFVGMTTAGHEKREIEKGGPRAMVEAYQRVTDMGLGCEGHYGEGAGVEHMMKAHDLFHKDTRYAHGYQVIELPEAIEKVRARGIPLIMSPCINVNLGGVVHYKDGKPHHKLQRDAQTGALIFDEKIVVDEHTHEEKTIRIPRREKGIVNHYIENLEDHPIWRLMREHHMPIGLMSDDPQQGGVDYKIQAKQLAGLTYNFPKNFQPLTAEEFALCNLNATQVAFCEPELKVKLIDNIAGWMKDNNITVEHPLLT